jgi:hypothetical protein
MEVNTSKPRILLFIDKPGWAFHTIASAIAFHLSDLYTFTILAASDAPQIDESRFDIIHVFGSDQTYHHPFINGKCKILKGIYSHLWTKHHFHRNDFYALHLEDADAVTVPSMLLLRELHDLPIPVFLFPEGVDTGTFTASPHQNTSLVVGWAGNNDPIKQFNIAKESCEGICEFRVADGGLSMREMVDFYHSIDVLLCTSIAEGCPRPVLEAMSCGRFPVSFPVGIVPEVIVEDLNGIIVRDTTVEGVRSALHTCKKRYPEIRNAWKYNAEYIRAHRQWRSTIWHISDAYTYLLQ